MLNKTMLGAISVLGILVLVSLGFTGYAFVKSQSLGSDPYDPEGLKLVALWDDLDENLENNPFHNIDTDFLIEFKDQLILDSDYVSLGNSTSFSLLIPGLYKINLATVLGGVDDADRTYWIELKINDTEAGYFARFTSGNPVMDPYYFAQGSLYINNTNSAIFYEINARSSHYLAGFSIATDTGSSYFNQLSIEYVLQSRTQL